MQLLYCVLSVVLALKAAAALYVDFSVPEVIYNEQALPVSLNVAGGDLGSGHISGVRTVLYVPTKREPKFAGNVSHTAFEADGSAVQMAPIYGLPVKSYQLGYSVEISYEDGQKEWVDSERRDVVVRDLPVSPVKVGGGIATLGAVVVGVLFLVTRLSVPGYWESRLPASMHWVLPEKPKRT